MNAEEREFAKVLENQEQVDQLEQVVATRGREWLHTADTWIKQNPYMAMTLAVVAGCAVVALLRKED